MAQDSHRHYPLSSRPVFGAQLGDPFKKRYVPINPQKFWSWVCQRLLEQVNVRAVGSNPGAAWWGLEKWKDTRVNSNAVTNQCLQQPCNYRLHQTMTSNLNSNVAAKTMILRQSASYARSDHRVNQIFSAYKSVDKPLSPGCPSWIDVFGSRVMTNAPNHGERRRYCKYKRTMIFLEKTVRVVLMTGSAGGQ
jgi:hypothetical protein